MEGDGLRAQGGEREREGKDVKGWSGWEWGGWEWGALYFFRLLRVKFSAGCRECGEACYNPPVWNEEQCWMSTFIAPTAPLG